MRALAGTAVGFAVGAALLIAIGTNPDALWAVLPVAVLVAAYAPGTTPFVVGQAAFTVTIVVLFNLLAPVGWTVGLLRIEDVAIGCAVSLAVGLLFWPRGVSSVVGDDLADAFRSGAAYLTQSVEWALSELLVPPSAALAAASAAIRLDDAVRGLPHRAGQQATDQGRPVDAGQRLLAAPAGRADPRRAADGSRPPPATSPAPACRWRARTSTRARRPASCCGRPPRAWPATTRRSPRRSAGRAARWRWSRRPP